MLPAAFAAVNADDAHASIVQDTKAKVVTMAVQGVADERARLIENQITGLVLHLDGQELYSQLVGGFNASNLLAVYVVSKLLGTDKMNALTQMSLLKPPAGRYERVPARDGITAIVDTLTPPMPWTTCSKPLPTSHRRRTRDHGGGLRRHRDKTKRPTMAQALPTGPTVSSSRATIHEVRTPRPS